jgi:hypothetical protein
VCDSPDSLSWCPALICFVGYNVPEETEKGDVPMAVLRCPCGGEHEIWGELWWVGGYHEWVFFDDLQTSETYSEDITHCPGCGRQLERKALNLVKGA